MKIVSKLLMTYSAHKFLIIVLLSLTSLPSFNCYAVETERITQLIDFITENSSLNYNESMGLPRVIPATPAYLQTLAFTEVQVAEAKKSGIALPEVTGYFDRYTNTVYVSEKFPLDTNESNPTLVHELVHFLQLKNGITQAVGFDRLACLEPEAYDIQHLYEILNGYDYDLGKQYSIIMIAHMMCAQQFRSESLQ